jgi:hypothetical protein
MLFRVKLRKVVPAMDKQTISAVMREMGRKGGKIGGKRSLETMTPAERTARAKKAAAASAKVRSAKKH